MAFIMGLAGFVVGENPWIGTFYFSRMIFLRLLGIIYGISFLSLLVQAGGLWGEKGLLPVGEYLEECSKRMKGKRGKFSWVPTLLWWNSSDTALKVLLWAGIFFSFLLVLGVAPGACLLLLWFLYLSAVAVGQDFLSFQWDVLLLEVTFISIFLIPFPYGGEYSVFSPLVVLALWWILFRLMFESGVVKLTSGDPHWKNLTALLYHYETQPLPTRWGWWAHQLPPWFQKFSVALMFFIELVIPFFIFFPPPWRYAACGGFLFLQFLIFMTGNYTFFNLLTAALCLFLLDDGFWGNVLPNFLLRPFLLNFSQGFVPMEMTSLYWSAVLLLTLTVFFLGIIQLIVTVFPKFRPPLFYRYLMKTLSSFRSFNSYGLFRVMTTVRREIIVQGSADGLSWKDYEFSYKPGNLYQVPRWAAPHQPRLDWQMWFAAFGNYWHHPWFINLLFGLLKNQKEILALIQHNPFPHNPPKYIRSRIYRYRFTDWKTRKSTGQWWQRDEEEEYSGPMFLKEEGPEGPGPQEF